MIDTHAYYQTLKEAGFDELKDEISRSTQRTVGFLATYTTLIVAIAAAANHFVR